MANALRFIGCPAEMNFGGAYSLSLLACFVGDDVRGMTDKTLSVGPSRYAPPDLWVLYSPWSFGWQSK
jgi:hypothetical protein